MEYKQLFLLSFSPVELFSFSFIMITSFILFREIWDSMSASTNITKFVIHLYCILLLIFPRLNIPSSVRCFESLTFKVWCNVYVVIVELMSLKM